MNAELSTDDRTQVVLCPVSGDNWREIAKLGVSEEQKEFVAEPCYYLALCCYGDIWRPLAICLDDQVIGFMMWGEDTYYSS